MTGSDLLTVDLWSELKYIFLCEITTNVRLFTSGLPDETTATQFSGPRPADRPGESRTAVTFSIFQERDRPGTRAGHLVAWREINATITNGPLYPLGTGQPLVTRSVIDTNILLQPSYSPGNEPDWNDTWWRKMSLTKAPMGPALLEIVKLESKD